MMLHQLAAAGKQYVRDMELEDIWAFKVCLISFGTLLGLTVSKRNRKPTAIFATVAFFATLIPLMGRFFASLIRVRED